MTNSLVSKIISRIRQQKLMQDITYSVMSFFVLGVSGIVINIAITATRNAAALAVFNLAYAVYIIASQFAAWGIHYSVLRYAAYYHDDPVERGQMLFTASSLSILFGFLVATVIAQCEPLFAYAFHSDETGRAIFYAACGLTLFPLNKVLLAYLNGLRKIKAFSALQGLRYLTVMVVVTLVSITAAPIVYATFAFLIAEALTVFFSCLYLYRGSLTGLLSFSSLWAVKHLKFGTKSLMAGMFTEINTRVDVLMIGFFLTEHATGVYSFAAMLVDGLYHVLAMIRINFNPILVGILRDGDWSKAKILRAQSQKYVLPILIVLSIVLICAYDVLATYIMPGKSLLEGLPSLVILLFGLNLIAIFVPFDNLLVISGHPGYQTIQQFVMVISNIIAAVLFVPVIGIEGAAIGTVISYLAGILMMMFFTHRLLSWNLFLNKVRV